MIQGVNCLDMTCSLAFFFQTLFDLLYLLYCIKIINSPPHVTCDHSGGNLVLPYLVGVCDNSTFLPILPVFVKVLDLQCFS